MASTPTLAAASSAMSNQSELLRHEPASSSLHCCCGRVDCAFLKKNCSVLETVEKDVHTAAQLGQALLVRHEAYMADAERDRLALTAKIEQLESDKQMLEAENASKIEENRNLLDQLELMNNTVCDSDARIKILEASLLSSQQSVRELENAAARAADAERHLAVMEEEQANLHNQLQLTQEDARSHAQRCKEAQRGILDMQDQLERIENEARRERDRHAEVVHRMERQREVEKQLDTAAGRLKGAAATKSMQVQKNGTGIVSHFVRDLLQDNANLQLGIAELREMLMNSNDEIQSLREQLMFHQPVEHEVTTTTNVSTPMTLKAELETHEPPRISQELHVHHHYHVTPKQDTRKPKKKRHGLAQATFSPLALSQMSSPSATDRPRLVASPTAPALLSRNALEATPAPAFSLPSQKDNGWAMFSSPPSELASSVPSSPLSNKHHSSLFDHVSSDNDLPTSPSSFDPMSPTWYPSHSKRPSQASTRSFGFASIDSLASSPPTPQVLPTRYHDDTIHEEDEEDLEHSHGGPPGLMDHATSTEDSVTDASDLSKDDFAGHGLHRSPSHESIMSLTGGLDIHTLKARPSQMTLRPLGGAGAIVTGITARPTLSRGSTKRSDAALRDTFIGLQSPTPRSVSSPYSSSPSQASTIGPGSLGKWVGWRPWAGGGGSTSSASVSGANSGAGGRSVSYSSSPAAAPDFSRSTGINQAGAIPGFAQYWASQKRKGAPAKVNAEAVDREALSHGLLE